MEPKLHDLGKTQRHVLEYIEKHIKQNGWPPSVREIGKGVQVPSTGAIQYHLDQLEAKGFISRIYGQSRSITVLVPTQKQAIHSEK